MEMESYQAILIPSDGRPPSLVPLATSPVAITDPFSVQVTQTSRMPHPEVYMDYIAESLGSRAWQYHLVEALDGMNKKFDTPYIIFYPVISRDGMPFPVNKCVREIQGRLFREDAAWRGNLVVAKYAESSFTSMMNASMADFPLIKNYLMQHKSPLTPVSPAGVGTSRAC
ncbi:hypothetical protein GLOTRDRAFT_34002 [Gloeophyllum trabeum ATCC 11539]|uniref:Uncharacterized protein n=1 Tax=Gloeophyllum trabeum (strain ATCC 11539 / FP-39264 / Madison 617) TaxID=670483 RepID=S7RXA2_GLOTA|nr:uncharacterized protein GLOTRDRAFT_34002 [Gloeophyllum trabeum ATCC 11539]EPQ59510.1 hypothetical protein GLOTRDRAFT_34002 [Gloeophyllum trabeum ATCC 11539]